ETRTARECAGEGRIVLELDIEIFAADQPAVAERVFPSAADRPPGARSALDDRVGDDRYREEVGSADDRLRAVERGPCRAAGYVEQRLVSGGEAEPGAGGRQPPRLQVPVVGRVEGSPGNDGDRTDDRGDRREGLAFLVRLRPVALEPEHPPADLNVTAGIDAADEAAEVEGL